MLDGTRTFRGSNLQLSLLPILVSVLSDFWLTPILLCLTRTHCWLGEEKRKSSSYHQQHWKLDFACSHSDIFLKTLSSGICPGLADVPLGLASGASFFQQWTLFIQIWT